MKAEDVQLTQLLDGAKQFIVPVFQRDYSWETKHCLQLWKDIIQAGSTQNIKVHFVGSIVYIAAEENSAKINRWLLIDGQQRLTTVLLLLIALRDFITLKASECLPPAATSVLPTAAEIDDYYLINRHALGEDRHKLQLRRSDQESLAAIMDKAALPAHASERIAENFAFFQDLLADADLTTLFAGIKKLVAVQVVLLRGQDDPQLIFESLNSTGLELAQADLIRNFVLMRQEEHVQADLYDGFWRPMEVEFDSRYRADFDRFVRDYLTLELKPSKQFKAGDIYRIFREYFYAVGGEQAAASILAELRRHSSYYVSFSSGKHSDKNLSKAFRRLRSLVDVAAPLVMRLYHCYDRAGTLTLSDFIEATEILESYVFRRSVCELETRSLGRIFSSLAYSINETEPLQSLKIALALQGPNRRFPDDAEFKVALETQNLYSMRHCHYLLDRIENQSKERIDTSEFTIEHILPQNPRLSKEWRAMLGASWKEVQDTWVHRLGNVTLSGYNPEYSDRSFDKKKTMTGGFLESPLRLNKFVREQDQWTEVEMEKRGKSLASAALKIWRPMQLDEDLLKQAKLKQIKDEAAKYTSASLEIEDDHVRDLLIALSAQILALGDDVTEIYRAKSVTYRVLDHFVEVIPRKQHLTLAINMDFEDCDDPSQLARDASNKAFITNASESGGVTFPLWSADEIPAAMHIVKQAYEQIAQ